MATCTVDTLADIVDVNDGVTSLREAVAAANANPSSIDRIEFSVSGTIGLTNTALRISSDVTIDGGGAITLDGGGIVRVLRVFDGNVALDGLTITGGFVGDSAGFPIGAGIEISRPASVTLSDSTVTDNVSRFFGGGIANDGILTIIDSTISSNDAVSDGGGIFNTYVLNVTNSTISGNEAIKGGGLSNAGNDAQATLVNTTVFGNDGSDGAGILNASVIDLTHVTITGNDAGYSGGGLLNTSGAQATLQNVLISGNDADGGPGDDLHDPDGSATTNGSVIGGDPTAIFAATQTMDGFTSGVLADNGGPVQTVALLDSATNAAIDTGGDGLGGPATDARGNARAVDVAGVDNGGLQDAGAYELGTGTAFDPDQTLTGTSGRDTLTGAVGDDQILGLGGADILTGGAGDDMLGGGLGDDLLIGGAGGDVVAGGNGADIASYQGSGGGFTGVVASLFRPATFNTGDAVGDTYISIEGLSGTQNGDLLDGDTRDNILIGLDGDDTLNGRGGVDILDGGAGVDTLYGGQGDDTLFGGAGGDVLSGGAGVDIASYQPGGGMVTGTTASLFKPGTFNTGDAVGDTYFSIEGLSGTSGADLLDGDTGGNILIGLDGNDTLNGRDGADTLIGGEGLDTLYGGTGDDTLIGGAGGDSLAGGGGVDIVSYTGAIGVSASLFKPGTFNAGDAAGDTYILIEGLEGSSGNDLLDGNAGDNILIGQDGDDTLNGRDAADTLLGGDGDDTLYGGMGDDTLTGGAGADVLSGGAGSDTFAFTAPEEGGDTLFSFTRGEDTIRLSQAGFAGLELGVLSADDLGSGPPDDSMDRLYLTGNDLFYDGDGNGSDAAIRLFTLDGGASIVASDILIV